MSWILVSPAVILVISAVYILKLRRALREQQRQIHKLTRIREDLESSLERRRQRLDVLLSAVNEAVMRVDHLGRVLTANEQANAVFNMDASLELPQSMLAYYRNPDWNRQFLKALRSLPKATSLPDMIVGERALAARLAPLGKNQALLLCLDITRQAKLEKQRRTFLSNLMHDMKTPLTSMLGYARSIQKFDDNPELRREAANVIAGEAMQVNKLLDDLLTLELIEHGERGRHISNSGTQLATVYKQVFDTLAPRMDERKITMQCIPPDPGIAVAMDEVSLFRILMNVLDNAIQYSPDKGRIIIEVDGKRDHCLLKVLDEGPGIPEKDLVHVTERFYRVDKARSRSEGGHGLGLAIVKELLSGWNGDIQIRNREPRGLEVCIRIPALSAVNEMEKDPPQAASLP
jgi:two-component system phosphate regulon sensor histidine kinase PhoR